MNLQKITNISVVLLAVLALIVLGVIIGQGDEYIEMSAMQGNFGAVSLMINLALLVLAVTVAMTLVFSVKNLVSEKSKMKKAGISIGSFLAVFVLAFVLSSGVETPLPDGGMLSATQSKLVEAGIRTFYLLTIIAGGIMVYFSVSKYFKNNMGRRSAPEVNAGSMADIAFLLLIFFLVTTTIETDSGINRKLPPMEEIIDPPIIKERNIFTVVVNKSNQILVEEKLMDLRNLRSEAVAFLDNGGGLADEACNYCQGSRDRSSSDNPDKAIISLKNDRETDYKVYISVQNELVAAYNELRNREFARLYPQENMDYVQADKKYTDPRTDKKVKEKLKEKLGVIKLMFPMKLSEAEPNKTS